MAGLLDILFNPQMMGAPQQMHPLPWQVPQGTDPVPPRPTPQDLPPLPPPVEVPGRKVAAMPDQPMMPPGAQPAVGGVPPGIAMPQQPGQAAQVPFGINAPRPDILGSMAKGTPFQGLTDWIGQNRGALLGLAAGMAGAPSIGEGLSRGFRGAAAGQMMDQHNGQQAQAQQTQNATARYLISKGLSPDQAMAMLGNPAALGDYLKAAFVAPEKATYGVIGKDPYGNEQYGWINAGTQTVTPSSVGGMAGGAGAPPGAPGGIPAAPPGADPKIWRAEQTKAAVDQQTSANSAADTATQGQRYVQRAYDLYKKLGEAGAIGPIAASGPNRFLTGAFGSDKEAMRQEYEAVQKQLELLQAQINMKGQGAITESERKILGLTLPRLDAANPQTGLNILQNLGTDFNSALQKAGRVPAPVGAPASQQTAPAQVNAPSEGATATNPATGQKIQFRNGQWVPM